MSGYLEHIEQPQDVARLPLTALGDLCRECREAIVTSVGVTGGHLGSNLAMVEATVALHYVFDMPKDKIVFDVSHQCYTHKMLTGRKSSYLDPQHYGEVSGFTNPQESPYDLFRCGHTSQGVSLALGLAKARDVLGQSHNVIAVLGDGALSGGEALEGLDNAAEIGTNLIVVFNDNEMSIAPNAGGLYAGLAELRHTGGTAQHNIFKDLGLDYRYVEHGNDVEELVQAFSEVKDIDHPVVVHIHTVKGKGSPWAESHQEASHSYPGDAALSAPHPTDYREITRAFMREKIAGDKSIVVINAGTPGGVGLTPEFRASLGSQFVDTGITEQHAVAFAAGCARGGAKPIFYVMSTFLQRSFDQLIQELGLNRCPATILVFGAGFYDIDATHSGTTDLITTGNIPGLTCLAPATKDEYLSMLDWSLDQTERPVVIRVPEKIVGPFAPGGFMPERPSAWNCVRRGSKVCLLTIGATVELGLHVADLLAQKAQITPTVVEALNYSSFDEPLLDGLLADHELVVTVEPGILCGGFGEKVARYFGATHMRVLCYGGKKEFLDRVPTDEFYSVYHFTPADITDDVCRLLAL
ncbi:MAG: 1-deoxy-D-xylulose-5-phosphate synthase [Atopobiaceae bacterium]